VRLAVESEVAQRRGRHRSTIFATVSLSIRETVDGRCLCPLVKLAFHDADTDIFADILARIVARMSACLSACHTNNFNRACRGRVGEDPREEVGVGVGVVECEL